VIRQIKRHGGNPNPPPPPVEHQFKPGQSGNPSGRPKLLGESYKTQLAKVVPGDEEGRTYAEVIANAMALEAMKGEVPAAREIRAATEGDKFTGDVMILDVEEIEKKRQERWQKAGPMLTQLISQKAAAQAAEEVPAQEASGEVAHE
jgi:hypothetical protein